MRREHELSDIANTMEVSEFEVFRMAYRGWYGVNANPEEIERTFGRYLVSGEMPGYVLHFCQQQSVLEA